MLAPSGAHAPCAWWVLWKICGMTLGRAGWLGTEKMNEPQREAIKQEGLRLDIKRTLYLSNLRGKEDTCPHPRSCL